MIHTDKNPRGKNDTHRQKPEERMTHTEKNLRKE